jgi:hypothetical protein
MIAKDECPTVITDFVSGREIKIGELIRMADAGAARPPVLFSMFNWVTVATCGYAGCLVGTYAMDVLGVSDLCHLSRESMLDLSESFGLSNRERRFVFSDDHLRMSVYSLAAMKPWNGRSPCECPSNRPAVIDATFLPQAAAVRRLRKLIAYKMRKALYTGNDDARLLGDVGIVAGVLKEVKDKETINAGTDA